MKSAGRIVVLDDEPAICDIVVRCLQPGGYVVQAVQTGEQLRRALSGEAFDLLILDLNLRGEDGLTILNDITREYVIPTIILTARGELVDRVVGLELGADDYVPKPFEPRELLARVRSVLRRVHKPQAKPETGAEPVYWFDELSLNPQSREVFSRNGEPISLTTTQFDILHALVTHPNRALTRDQIMTLARDKESTPFDRSIDVHVGHLRRKLERNPQEPALIKTVHGVGYIFSAPVTTRSA
jgi:two-component system, OmpR family, response regulator